MVPGVARLFARACCAAFVATVVLSASASAQGRPAPAQGGASTGPAASEASLPKQLGGNESRTRFVIGLEQQVQFQVFSLSNPNRVIVELPDVRMQLPPASAGGVGLVKTFQGGQAGEGKTRVVIEVTKPVVVENAKVEKEKDGKSSRLVLDIVPVDLVKAPAKKAVGSPTFALGAAGVQPPLPKPALRPDQRAAKAFKPIIVLDPGHGGHDSGAKKFGTVEKEVVLAFAKSLRDKLEKTGRYKVLMTRDSDVFVELGERVAFAERSKANLFIAIHADYAGANARGATIYSLRDGVANALKRSAKDDAAAKALAGSEATKVKPVQGESGNDVAAVKGILSDLAEREVETTRHRTSLFTRSIVEYMSLSTAMRHDPDKQAAFRVLKTAQFPSVLIELAYVTNKQDADNLKSDSWRDKVANSILTGIENYFSHQSARLPL